MTKQKRIAAAFGAAALFLISASLPAQDVGDGFFPQPTFDFGIVRQGEILQHAFALENHSSSPVKIQILGLSLPGMKIRTAPRVGPTERASISVEWDTRSVHGQMTARVLVRLNDAEAVPLTLSANVVPPIDILPYPAVFISGFRDETTRRTLEIVNNEQGPLEILGLAGIESDKGVSANLKTLEAGRRYQIDVELKPGARIGSSQQILEVSTDHPRLSAIRIPVNILVKDDVFVNPGTVDFGEVGGASNGSETFILQKRGGPIEILSVESDVPGLNISRKSDRTGSLHQFSVELRAGSRPSSAVSGKIRIKTDDPAFAEITVPVTFELQ